MTTGFVDEPRLAGLMVRETLRRLRGVGPAMIQLSPIAGRRAGRILAVPAELRRAEPGRDTAGGETRRRRPRRVRSCLRDGRPTRRPRDEAAPTGG